MKLTWDDVREILYDGTEEEIKAARCPDCGGTLKYEYSPETRGTEITCNGCFIFMRGYKAHYVPNFHSLNKKIARANKRNKKSETAHVPY